MIKNKNFALIFVFVFFNISCKQILESGNTKVNYEKETITAKGSLFLVGGGPKSDTLMQNFIDLDKTQQRNILIIPFANANPEKAAKVRQEQFLRLGANSCEIFFSDIDKIDDSNNLDKLSDYNMIFFIGGSQRELAKHLNNTLFLEKIKSIYNKGGIIGGDSAGSAIMSRVMITGEDKEIDTSIETDKFLSLKKDKVVTNTGFGFLNNIIIDQHFFYRKRQNRLFSALLDNPTLRGVGIDESTAIIVKPGNTIEVKGERSVMIIEPHGKNINDDTIPAFTVRLFSEGDSYSL